MRGETVMVIVSKLHLLGDAAGYCVNGKFAATLFRSLSDGGEALVCPTQQIKVEPKVRFVEVGFKR